MQRMSSTRWQPARTTIDVQPPPSDLLRECWRILADAQAAHEAGDAVRCRDEMARLKRHLDYLHETFAGLSSLAAVFAAAATEILRAIYNVNFMPVALDVTRHALGTALGRVGR